jgi:histidyl-tRNA synthetase
MFLGRKVPACGFSLGLERIILIMEQRGLFPVRITGQPEVMVTQFSDETVAATLKLTRKLRDAGIRADLYPSSGKYGKQFKYADQRQIRYAVLLSPHEIEAEVVSVKDLSTGVQEEISPDELVTWLKSRLRSS